jgi:hypothetical protein
MKTVFILSALLLITANKPDPKPAPKPDCKYPGQSCSASSKCCYRNVCEGGVCKDGDPRPSGDEYCSLSKSLDEDLDRTRKDMNKGPVADCAKTNTCPKPPPQK